jgi:hypothetical protein
MKKELIQNIIADDKGSEVFFETVMQKKVEELKELRKKDIARKLLTEDYVVEVTTKDGEIFRTGKMKSDKKHWKLAKGNKYKSVKVVKEEEEDLEESAPDQTELAIETIQKFIKQKRAMKPDDLQKLLRFVPKGGSKRRDLGRDSIQTAVTRKRALMPDDLKKLLNMLTEESNQRINLNKNKQTIQDLEKVGVKNVYRKHPLPIQREKMLRDAANAGLIKLK